MQNLYLTSNLRWAVMKLKTLSCRAGENTAGNIFKARKWENALSRFPKKGKCPEPVLKGLYEQYSIGVTHVRPVLKSDMIAEDPPSPPWLYPKTGGLVLAACACAAAAK